MKNLPLAVVISAVDRVSAPLARIGGNLQGFGSKAAKVGQTLTLGVTAPVVGLFTLATRKALETERAMARLAATSNASAAELARAAAVAGAVPGDFDPKHGLDALTQMGKLGLSLSQGLAALPAATNLAIAAESDLATTSAVTIKVLRAYGLELEEVARVTDLLAQANAATDLGLDGLASQLVQLSPLARSAGLRLEDVASAVIGLGKAGQAPVNVLRASIARLLNPTKAVAETLTRLSIRRGDLFTTTGELRGLADLVEVLGQRGATASDLLELFGTKAGPGMTALLQQGAGSMRASAASLGRVGAAAQQAGRRISSAEGALWELDNALDDIQLSIANSGLLQNVAAAARGLADMAAQLNRTDPRIIQVGVNLAATAAVLGPVVWLVGKATSAVGALGTAWSGLAAAMAPAAAALSLPATAIAGLSVGLGALARLVFEFREQIGGALDDFARTVTDSKLFRAAEWLATMGGTIDLVGRQAAARREGALAADLRDAGPGGQGLGRDALRRAAEINRMVATANGQAEVLVRFEGAPRGTQATVQRAAGVGVGLDLGYSMMPE